MTGKQREDLLIFLFGDATSANAAACGAWIAGDARLATFLFAHREKVRKKLRTAEGPEGARDVLAELEVAWALLRERRFDLAYETYAAEKTAGPDFTVTYRGHIRFNVEVKRLRAASGAALEPRLTDAVCSKLRQMPPSAMNTLVVLAAGAPESSALDAMLRAIIARAEAKDAAFLGRYGFAAPRDFFAGFLRLSAVVVRDVAGGGATLWLNPQARHPLHADLPLLLTRCMG